MRKRRRSHKVSLSGTVAGPIPEKPKKVRLPATPRQWLAAIKTTLVWAAVAHLWMLAMSGKIDGYSPGSEHGKHAIAHVTSCEKQWRVNGLWTYCTGTLSFPDGQKIEDLTDPRIGGLTPSDAGKSVPVTRFSSRHVRFDTYSTTERRNPGGAHVRKMSAFGTMMVSIIWFIRVQGTWKRAAPTKDDKESAD